MDVRVRKERETRGQGPVRRIAALANTRAPLAPFDVRERAFLACYKKSGLCAATVRAFRSFVLWFYRHHGRHLPWRDAITPYRVFVSEVMLQQTQVPRVAEKFPLFVKEFPDFAALARAPLSHVLKAWQGMGYNRRALSLKRAAELVVANHDGTLPTSPEALVALPGIGRATAASIAAYAFNSPTVFVETNIRAVFIHYFFARRENVHDEDIVALVAKTLDTRQPANWYNALMDLGTLLKSRHGNPAVRSARHRRQSSFAGSVRQVRGMILKHLLHTGSRPIVQLGKELDVPAERFDAAVRGLEADGLIRRRRARVELV